jgi:nicotinate phosphoribosyltransferase
LFKRFGIGISEGILFTDQYQFAMAQLFYRLGIHELTVQFDHFFRAYPNYGAHQAGFCINAGLERLLQWMQRARFGKEEAEVLRLQRSSSGERMFKDDFLVWMSRYGTFDGLSLHAVPEGRVVHRGAPLTVVTGPIALAQILETPLLNMLNYQTLIATKACRLRLVCGSQLLMEFGARRGQDRGAITGTRAALIGGADFTSNVGISHLLGYSPKGTHAHSLVQLFLALGMGELDAFRAFGELYPDDCVLLVDTINSIESGIPNAIKVFEELRRKGHSPVGIRLDSGDLAYLSIQAARMLDAAGFPEVNIVLSNDLDELSIWQIKTQIVEESRKQGLDPDRLIRRLAYGVGTRLITSAGDSALGGVYKLVSVRGRDGWTPAIKISETLEKIPNPGKKQVWRIYDRRKMATADLITLDDEDPRSTPTIGLRHPDDHTKRRVLFPEEVSGIEPLLVAVFDDGRAVCGFPPINEMRKLREADVERLDEGVKRLVYPHTYHVSISQRLWDLKQKLIQEVTK